MTTPEEAIQKNTDQRSFWRPRTVDVEVPDLGTIQVGNGTIGVLNRAMQSVKGVVEQEVPHHFVNHLLAQMCLKPTFTAEEIASWTDDQVLPILETVVDLQDASTFAKWDGGRDIRKVAYDAIESRQRSFYEQYTKPALTSIASVWNVADSLGSSMATKIALGGNLADVASGIQPFDTISAPLAAMDALGDSLSISPSIFAQASSLEAGSMVQAIGMLNNSIEELSGVGTIDSAIASARLSGNFELLARSVSSIFDQAEFGRTLTARALIGTGIDTPYIHTTNYVEPAFVEIDNEEDAVEAEEIEREQRRIRCQDVLFKLEASLRRFIENSLSNHAGNGWWRQRVPHDIRIHCRDLKAEREAAGNITNPLIAYAYLGHLTNIITQRANWDEVFVSHFRNKTVFEAMMMWINTVRNDVDHARYSANEEYIQFMTAANWMHRCMGLDEPYELSE